MIAIICALIGGYLFGIVGLCSGLLIGIAIENQLQLHREKH